MLYSVDTKIYITDLPYKKDYDTLRKRLTTAEYNSIEDHLNALIDTGDIHTSSWMPGSDWSNTPLQLLYDKACRKDPVWAGKFFGQILFKVMRDRSEVWGFGRYEKNGVPIRGITYFQLNLIP